MKLTKYSHACQVLEEQGQRLVIDPGSYSDQFGPVDNVVAVVVTHVHGDHFSPDNLKTIIAANPDVRVFTTKEVAQAWGDPHAVVVSGGQGQLAGPFKLDFFGELHAVVLPMFPRNQNVGVLVNQSYYYPGDSLTVPTGAEVKMLALPGGAPWLKISEAVELLAAVRPKRFIRAHDGMLNEHGLGTTDFVFDAAAKNLAVTYEPLNPGQSTEI